MAAQIPPRRSWWYYIGRWFAITAAFFIWVVIDSLDVPSKVFPALEQWEPAWIQATVEVRVVPMLTLIASMIVATIVVIWIVRCESDALRQVATRADQGGLSITQQFRKIHDELIALKDCWEGDYPAGPEAWRKESESAAKRAEMLLRQHFSQKVANQFGRLTWRDWKGHPEIDYGDSKENQRIALGMAQVKFLYRYATD